MFNANDCNHISRSNVVEHERYCCDMLLFHAISFVLIFRSKLTERLNDTWPKAMYLFTTLSLSSVRNVLSLFAAILCVIHHLVGLMLSP